MAQFYDWLGQKKSHGIRLAVMDMWKPFRNTTRERAPQAAVLFDKFHIMRHLGEALDKVRKTEYARVSGKGRRFIKGQKYTLLARHETSGCHRCQRHSPFLVNVGLALDLDHHSRINQSLHLDERGGRQIFAEVSYAARIDLRPFRDVGHENLHLDDMLGTGASRLQALVHHGDGDVELGNNVGRYAAVLRLANDASDPNVGACAGDVAIVADWL